MSAKIQKTIARQQERIAAGDFYEAHQQLRVIASRYIRSNDTTSATSILKDGTLLLLNANQGGSGGDLSLMLLNDVYVKNSISCTSETKKPLLEILHAFPPHEPTRKRFAQECISWSSKVLDNDRGDSELHHEIGSIYASEGAEPYLAEQHLVLGTPPAASTLASMEYTWYASDSPHTAPLYASRCVLPYLVNGNLSGATKAFAQFTSQLTTINPSLLTQSIDSSKSSIRIFPSLPLLNFLALLLLACQKSDAALYRQLCKHYSSHLKEIEELWAEALANIGEIWFGIRIPKQGNPLFDMMSGMFGVGGGGQQKKAGTPKPKADTKAQAAAQAPQAMDLD